jgi:hypothetical protein
MRSAVSFASHGVHPLFFCDDLNHPVIDRQAIGFDGGLAVEAELDRVDIPFSSGFGSEPATMTASERLCCRQRTPNPISPSIVKAEKEPPSPKRSNFALTSQLPTKRPL